MGSILRSRTLYPSCNSRATSCAMYRCRAALKVSASIQYLECDEIVSARLRMLEAFFGKHSNTLRGDCFRPSVTVWALNRLIMKFGIGVPYQKLCSKWVPWKPAQWQACFKGGRVWVPTHLYIFIYGFGSNSVQEVSASAGSSREKPYFKEGHPSRWCPIVYFFYRVTEFHENGCTENWLHFCTWCCMLFVNFLKIGACKAVIFLWA